MPSSPICLGPDYRRVALVIDSRFRDAHLSVHLGNFAALTELSERASVITIASWIHLAAGGEANSNGVVSACRRTVSLGRWK